MMPAIGHVIVEGLIQGQDAYGRGWFIETSWGSKSIRVLLKKSYIPCDVDMSRGNRIRNLIVVGKGKRFYFVGLVGYMKDLINYYLPINNIAEKSKWIYWHQYWKEECKEDFIKNFTVEELDIPSFTPLSKIFKLKGRYYILPIIGYKDLDCLKGNPLFYPDTFYNQWIARCVYKTDTAGDLPTVYKAKFSGNYNGSGLISKDVLIFLHGFTSPSKWHYDIWKHVLGLAPNATPSEDNLIDLLEKEPIEKNHVPFNNCKLNDKGTSCNESHCIQKSLFKNVHSEIKNYCHAYLKQSVTLFKSNSTNILRVFNRPNDDCKEIRLMCGIDINQERRLIQILYGKCHNWNDNRPVFHFSLQTMYCRYRNKCPDPKFDRGMLIFEGNLKEIEDANQ